MANAPEFLYFVTTTTPLRGPALPAILATSCKIIFASGKGIPRTETAKQRVKRMNVYNVLRDLLLGEGDVRHGSTIVPITLNNFPVVSLVSLATS